MAISGKLVADFGSFYDAVQKAEVSLKSFESGSEKVSASLTRVANGLSGRKVIQDATLMAEAIEQIGGMSRLTEAELARVGTTAAEAVEKMQALGQEVPANLQALARHAKTATGEFGSLKSVVTDLAGGFVAAFSASKALAFVEGVGQQARALRNLSIETDIGTTKLQTYGAVTGDLGVTTEELGKAIFAMSNRIAGGDTSMAGALHTMGLTFEEFKGQAPDAVFEKILRNLDLIPDHLTKSGVAADLVGPKIGAALVKVAHNFDDAVASARSLNTILDPGAVQAAAAAADNYDRLSTNVRNLVANALGPAFEEVNALTELSAKGASGWDIYSASIKDVITNVFGLVKGLGGFSGPGSELERLFTRVSGGRDINLPAPKAAAAAVPTDDQKMRAIEIDQIKALTASQEQYLERLFDINKLTKENAAAFGVSVEQMENFKKKEEDIIETQQLLSAQTKDMGALRLELEKRYGAALDISNAKEMQRLALRTTYIQSLREEIDAAKAVNLDRNLGPGQADPIRGASERRDRQIADINAKQAAFPSEDFSPLMQKVWQDFDAFLLGAGKESGRGAAPAVNMTVSGVWDPATIRQLTAAISQQLIQDAGRQF